MLNSIKDTPKPMSLLSLILSFLALFVIAGLLFVPIDKESKQVLIGLDFVICSVFLFQLTIDLFRSQNKKEYLKVHWIDFLASLLPDPCLLRESLCGCFAGVCRRLSGCDT